MAPYAGESDQKRIARARAYGSVLRVWKEIGYTPRGLAVGLIGHDAPEVPHMQMLGYSREQILMVDTEQPGVDEARARWPGILAERMCAAELLKRVSAGVARAGSDLCVDFAHLDLLGHVGGWSKDFIFRWGRQAKLGSVLVVTLYKGRESAGKYYRHLARTFPGVTRNALRVNSVWYELNRSGGEYNIFLEGEYTASSPMLMLGFVKRLRSSRKVAFGRFKVTRKSDIRDEVATYHRAGISSRGIAELLNVEQGTAAAWKAHVTRGTYG